MGLQWAAVAALGCSGLHWLQYIHIKLSHTFTRIFTHKNTHSHEYSHTKTHTHTYTHAPHTNRHRHTDTETQTHKKPQAHTHTHMWDEGTCYQWDRAGVGWMVNDDVDC